MSQRSESLFSGAECHLLCCGGQSPDPQAQAVSAPGSGGPCAEVSFWGLGLSRQAEGWGSQAGGTVDSEAV